MKRHQWKRRYDSERGDIWRCSVCDMRFGWLPQDGDEFPPLAGAQLSNLAFNLGQNQRPGVAELTERDRNSMRESQRAWDEARRKINR